MDIDILLVLQDFRNGIGSVLTGFMTKMSLIGEMEVVLVIIALLYWCVSKSYGIYFLMGWSANRVVNGLLKVTACVYRPWIRDLRILPDSDALATAAGLLVMWLTMKLMERIDADPKKDIPVMCIGIAIAIAVAVFAAVKSYPVDYDEAGKLLVDGAKMAKDTYKGVGWCIGFFAGWVLERRYVRFSTDVSIMARMTRLVTGLLSYYAVILILKAILNNCLPGVVATILITFIQTFYVTFVFPWCIKRWERQSIDLYSKRFPRLS